MLSACVKVVFECYHILAAETLASAQLVSYTVDWLSCSLGLSFEDGKFSSDLSGEHFSTVHAHKWVDQEDDGIVKASEVSQHVQQGVGFALIVVLVVGESD